MLLRSAIAHFTAFIALLPIAVILLPIAVILLPITVALLPAAVLLLLNAVALLTAFIGDYPRIAALMPIADWLLANLTLNALLG